MARIVWVTQLYHIPVRSCTLIDANKSCIYVGFGASQTLIIFNTNKEDMIYMKRYLKYLVFSFLIISIFANIYFLFLQKNSHNISQLNIDHPLKENEKLELQNPIDIFFENEVYPDSDGSAIETSVNAGAYQAAWKAEMDNAYSQLLNRAHEDLRNSIIASHEQFILFSDNEFYLASSIFSDGYGDEQGMYEENVNYGSDASVNGVYTVGRLYKQRTLELFKYLQLIGEDISFVFNEEEYQYLIQNNTLR